MELLFDYFVKNFFLICLALGVILMVLRTYRTKRITVLMPILVVSSALVLSIVYAIEMATKDDPNLVFISTLCCSLGFVIRPLVLLFFMKITMDNNIIFKIFNILIAINTFMYTLPLLLFVPQVAHVVFYYDYSGATVADVRGPLFYTCHIIIGIMMVYFLVHSIRSLSGRHRYDAIACLVCAGFVGIGAILESFRLADNLLNTTIAIACLFYMVHLYQQASIRDALTLLFDRKAYYSDLLKAGNSVTGLIAIDMNSLKWINDNEGHEAGDIALKKIADVLVESIDNKSMDAYRIGGDEFIIISTSSKSDAIPTVVNKITSEMIKTRYSIAIGYAEINEETSTVDELSKKAEALMYEDKARYYKTSGIERRKN